MSEYSRIFDGWLTRYKVNRPLNKYELSNRLKVLDAIKLPPADKGAVKLNGVFIEYVDRYFVWRGWAAAGGVVLGGVFLYMTSRLALSIYTPPINESVAPLKFVVASWIFTMIFGLMCSGVFFCLGRKDFFCYTHYPIRFNRKTRKVYIFQHNGPGGVIDIDWEKVLLDCWKNT
ncbi:DUF6708 domain-containing protein [Pseudomonas weihenstephanensis]|uniref:DUF6708 domain-containing protein n=1 Tax=Pseudomonas weihenstephanensis TaxID=1608994 RepID=UPI000A810DBE|nr:DUF6708 domain-containing protein [Pseudomonas weihenstephanensis]